MGGWARVDEWTCLLHRFLALEPFSASNVSGVQEAFSLLTELLEKRGFRVRRLSNTNGGADAIVALRDPRGSVNRWVGLFGHVDIEQVPSADKWVVGNPMTPTLLDGRWYCRGIADNLGPLLARLLVFSAADENCAGVVWTIHGEEEIGSPWAHIVYPTLLDHIPELSNVNLWMEETGYFRGDGTQRILMMYHHQNQDLMERLMEQIQKLAKECSRDVIVEERALNKAFGEDKCPCLTHLLSGEVPYLSIGINDSFSNIHEKDESVPEAVLSLADSQFRVCLGCELSL